MAYSIDGINWTETPSVFSTTCQSLGWNGTLFVAGGQSTNNNQLAYSTDGILWTASPSGSALITSECKTIAWNESRWVAGGTGGNQIIVSNDGINWTASNDGNAVFQDQCLSIFWNGAVFVAGGFFTNVLGYSYNGTNWFVSSAETITGLIFVAVTWNGAKWIAGGSNVAYSNDGINWTLDSPAAGFATQCLALASRKATLKTTQNRIVSDSFSVIGGDGPPSISYSYDGMVWQPVPTTSDTPSYCNVILWNGSIWVAGGSSGANTILYSSDGINWTVSASGSAIMTSACLSLGWNGQIWLAGGTASGGASKLASSKDGINWITVNQTLITTTISTVVWANGFWLIGGAGTNSMMYSYDGVNWHLNSGANSIFTVSVTTIDFCNGIYVAAGTNTADGPIMSYSTDGFSWATATLSPFDIVCSNISSNGSLWVACGESDLPATDVLAYSYDGMSWTASQVNTVFPSNVFSVTWNGTIWIAGAFGGFSVGFSYDGINWEASPSGTARFTECVAVASRINKIKQPPPSLSKSLGLYSIPSATNIILDCSLTDNFSYTLTGGFVPYTQIFTNLPPLYAVFKITLVITQGGGGSHTIIWDPKVSWGLSGAPTLSTAVPKIDIIELITIDGGLKWCAFVKGLGF